jgi:predicted outer membrane protein
MTGAGSTANGTGSVPGWVSANMTEVDAGKMALAKTQNAQVKSFAQRMVDDQCAGDSITTTYLV